MSGRWRCAEEHEWVHWWAVSWEWPEAEFRRSQRWEDTSSEEGGEKKVQTWWVFSLKGRESGAVCLCVIKESSWCFLNTFHGAGVRHSAIRSGSIAPWHEMIHLNITGITAGRSVFHTSSCVKGPLGKIYLDLLALKWRRKLDMYALSQIKSLKINNRCVLIRQY